MTPAQAGEIFQILFRSYGDVLDTQPSKGWGSPFQVLILTILSAQTTDFSVDKVREPLFTRFPTPAALAAARPEEVEEIIHSLGFFRVKARHLIGTAQVLLDRYSGEVPATMEDLLTLPGVGRKTANIVLYHAFGKNEGIAVDTHVKRLAHRIGFTDSRNQDTVEEDLEHCFPRDQWGILTDLFIAHGRAICTAQNPSCPVCPIRHLCRYYQNLPLPARTDGKQSP
ncbi:MAG: endonuclease III [Methanomicrobiales archaeon]|nr:endonuclease III [Methanomicrobiales archaeon]